jgi:CPA1 family monovalent cation:H+ antiporter
MELVGWLVLGVIAVVAVASVARKVGVAPPLILVVLGVVVSLVPAVPAIEVEPELILGVVLPPLLYSTAVSTPAMDFRRDLTTISGLSVGLVLVSAVVVGVAVSSLVPGVSLATGIALGAVVSPTDAVATTIVRRQGVSPRLVTILEGESLLNDASALVLLRTAVAASAATVSVWGAAGDFVRAVVVAALVGFLVGKADLMVRSRLHPATLGVAVSLVAPFAAYIPSEHLGGSGLVAAVVAGLVAGQGAPRRLRPEDRMTGAAVWRTLELLLEGAVFLLMGLELFALLEDLRDEHGSLGTALWLAVLTGAIVIVVRAAFVVPSLWLLHRRNVRGAASRDRLSGISDRLADIDPARWRPPGRGRVVHAVPAERQQRRADQLRLMVRRRLADIDYLAAEPVGWREGTLLVWAGMRGAVTLAAAQSLPASTPHRSTLVLVAFVVAAGTLLAQGVSLPWVVRGLGLKRADDDPQERADADALRSELAQAAAARLDDPALVRPDGRPYSPGALARAREVGVFVVDPDEPDEPGAYEAWVAARTEERTLRLDLLAAQRAALLRLRDEGTYSSAALADKLRVLDAEQIGLEARAVVPPDQD